MIMIRIDSQMEKVMDENSNRMIPAPLLKIISAK